MKTLNFLDMKYILFTLSALLILASCQEQEVKLDLAGKKKLLIAQKKKLKEIQLSIDTLTTSIEKEEPSKEIIKKTVTTTKLKTEEFVNYSEIQATVMSDDVVIASSETGGRITYLKAKEGQSVKKGQLIAKVDMQTIEPKQMFTLRFLAPSTWLL